jgi:hypothetical protein
MQNKTMKQFFLIALIVLTMSLACNLSVGTTPPTNPSPLPSDAQLPGTVVPTVIGASPNPGSATPALSATSTAQERSFEGMEVTVEPLSLVLSPSLADGARGIQVSGVDGEDAPWWQLAPDHIQIKLEGYLLQARAREPEIYVYRAQDYAELAPVASESIRRLDNMMNDPEASVASDQLPTIPFLNEEQAFASNIQLISFQNGQGVRFLTEYSQYAVSANNYDLFYQFQGVSRDGAYYILAILPISAPVLAETNDAGAALPPGGIPYPYFADPNADMQGYYASVSDLLNDTLPEAFVPTIYQLDLLIQSMVIAP